MQYCMLASTIDIQGARRLETSDRAAVHFALQADANTIAICPHDDAVAWEYAIASGVHSVVPAETTSPQEFELVWSGMGFAERMGEKFLARWAEHRGGVLLFDVLSCSAPTGGVRTIVCDAGRGARDELQVRGACVLVLSASVVRTPYVSRHRRSVARQQSACASISSQSATARPEWQPARPRVRTTGTHAELGADRRMDFAFAMESSNASASSSQPIVTADAETCAQQMIRYLAHHGFLSGSRSFTPEVTNQSGPVKEETAERRSVSARSVSPAVQRRPRWLDTGAGISRGPFWCDAATSRD